MTGDLEHLGRRIRAQVLRSTGIPVGIGIAGTKTLSKLANHGAKRWQSQLGGVLDIRAPARRDKLLKVCDVSDEYDMEKKGFAHRMGYRLGRLLRAYTRRETLIVKSLAMKGVPSVLTATMIWIVKLLLLGVLLYFTLWAALFYATLVFFGALQSWGLVFPRSYEK